MRAGQVRRPGRLAPDDRPSEAVTGEAFPAYGTGSADGARAELMAWMRRSTQLDRLASLAELGDAAAFLASDHAGAMTARRQPHLRGQVPAR